MPTYEYECKKCGKVTEVFQSMAEPPRRKLRKEDRPNCRCDAPVQRRISGGAGLIFKGSGFYITDYRSDSYKEAAKKESGTSPSGNKADAAGDSGGAKSPEPGTSEPASGASESKTQPAKESSKGTGRAKSKQVKS